MALAPAPWDFGPVIPPKRCTACKLLKAAYCFSRNARHSDGLYSRCRECHARTARASFLRAYHADPEKHKARAKSWRKANWKRWLAAHAEYKRRARVA